MRGVFCADDDCRRTGQPGLPGRRWFRQPYLGAHGGHAVSGLAAAHRTVPGGPYPRDRRPQEYYYPPRRRSWERRPRDQVRQRALSPVAPGTWPGQRQLPTHRPTAGDLHRQPMPPAFQRERRPPRPLAGQPAPLLPAARISPPGPAAAKACQAGICPPRLLDRSSRASPHRGPSRVHAQARTKPCPPPISHRFRGAVATA